MRKKHKKTPIIIPLFAAAAAAAAAGAIILSNLPSEPNPYDGIGKKVAETEQAVRALREAHGEKKIPPMTIAELGKIYPAAEGENPSDGELPSWLLEIAARYEEIENLIPAPETCWSREKCQSLTDFFANSYLNAAWADLKIGRYEKALQKLHSATLMKTGKGHEPWYLSDFFLGYAFLKLGKVSEARDALQEYQKNCLFDGDSCGKADTPQRIEEADILLKTALSGSAPAADMQ